MLGNAGSFFDPLVPAAHVTHLKQQYPDLVAYPQPGGQMKIAAGWLIERAGWKGFREGDAGVHKLQALVLVNYGNATGPQLLDLALRIQKDIANVSRSSWKWNPIGTERPSRNRLKKRPAHPAHDHSCRIVQGVLLDPGLI